jgi:PAS domain S-box-containing protein
LEAQSIAAGALNALWSHTGEMAQRIARHDWSSSLGPIEQWPPSLLTTVGLMIRSPVPMVLLWGEDGIMIYNDAYSAFAGGRHPTLLGSRVREGWPEVADFNDNVMKVGLSGRTLAYRDQELTLFRSGAAEQVWMNLDYSPVYDESGQPGGVIAIVVETTERVLSQRRLAAASARQHRQFEQAPGFIIIMTGPDHVVEFVNETHRTVFSSADWIGKPIREAFPSIADQGFFELLDDVYATGQPFHTDSAEVRFTRVPGEPPLVRYLNFIYAPISDEHGAVTGIFCDGFDVTERHRTESALQESRERLRLALDAAQLGAFVWYPQEDRAEADARMMALFGLPSDGILSLATALADRIHPADAARYAEAVGRATDPGGTGALREVIRVVLPGGDERRIAINGQVQFGGDPRHALRMAGTARDITEAYRTEAALRESEARLRFLDALGKCTAGSADADTIMAITTRMVGEYLGVAVCAYADMDDDQDGFSIRGDWSAPGSPSIVGHYSLAHFGKLAVKNLSAGQPLVINDNLRELAPEEAATFQSIGIAATICMPLVKAGRLTALMAIHDKVPRVWSAEELTTIREVTERSWAHIERIAAEAEVRASEENFRTLAGVMPNHVWSARPDGQFVWFNEQVYTFSGAQPGSLDGNGWRDIVHPDDQAETLDRWAHSIATGQTYEHQLRLRRVDGAWRWHLSRAVPIRGEFGHILRWIGTSTDIQDQKEIADTLSDINATLEHRVEERTRQLIEMQDALRQAQKMEAIGQLTGGIAHDFNNLLAGISGNLELLERRVGEGKFAGVQRYIDAAQGASRRAAALTQRLLAFSRRQTLDPKPLDVNRLVAGMEDLIQRTVGPDIELEVVGADGLWATRADPSQLENSLLNLCINARDAMAPNGGRLTIETANKWLDQSAAQQRDLPPGPYVSLCVTDTGTGMAPEVKERAFDPFFTTKPIGQGTGLGLSMIYGFIRQSGGQVRIYTELGKGTTMCLYLPRYLGAAQDEGVASEATVAPGHGETVLVVDDEEIVRRVVLEVLEENGYAALEASDGPSGLRILQSSARIDLLVTDVGLPGGLNGRQLADAARELRPMLKVLFITGYAENAVIGNGHLDPGMEVMTKPFSTTALGNRIRDLIDQR